MISTTRHAVVGAVSAASATAANNWSRQRLFVLQSTRPRPAARHWAVLSRDRCVESAPGVRHSLASTSPTMARRRCGQVAFARSRRRHDQSFRCRGGEHLATVAGDRAFGCNRRPTAAIARSPPASTPTCRRPPASRAELRRRPVTVTDRNRWSADSGRIGTLPPVASFLRCGRRRYKNRDQSKHRQATFPPGHHLRRIRIFTHFGRHDTMQQRRAESSGSGDRSV